MFCVQQIKGNSLTRNFSDNNTQGNDINTTPMNINITTTVSTTSTSTKSTTTNGTYLASGLGYVPKCTLGIRAREITVANRTYCLINRRKMSQSKGMKLCKSLNARLPLPKSSAEANAFRKITGRFDTWIGISDLTQKGIKEKWKDVEGNEIGNAYVKLRVIISHKN